MVKMEQGDLDIALLDAILLKSPFFEDLNESEYAVVTAVMDYRMVHRGVVVYQEGEVGDELYICLTGTLSASAGLSNGARRDLFVIKPGDFFGENAIITQESQIVTVAAEENSCIAVLQAQEFNRILSDFPLIAVKILRTIGRVQNDWFEKSSIYMDDLIRWGAIARRRTIQDELTGLYNRRFLGDSIRDRFQHWEFDLRKMSLIMIDLDQFHAVNEKYGVRAGDQVIVAVAEVIRSVMRSTDICAHFSGDEFGILLPDTSGKDAFHTACRLLDAINRRAVLVPERPGAEDYIVFNPRASMGIAEAPTHADTDEALKLAADRALHFAKEKGRNRVEPVL
jgi:diguanylate cyclase (GGDEF)-like protein